MTYEELLVLEDQIGYINKQFEKEYTYKNKMKKSIIIYQKFYYL